MFLETINRIALMRENVQKNEQMRLKISVHVLALDRGYRSNRKLEVSETSKGA